MEKAAGACGICGGAETQQEVSDNHTRGCRLTPLRRCWQFPPGRTLTCLGVSKTFFTVYIDITLYFTYTSWSSFRCRGDACVQELRQTNGTCCAVASRVHPTCWSTVCSLLLKPITSLSFLLSWTFHTFERGTKYKQQEGCFSAETWQSGLFFRTIGALSDITRGHCSELSGTGRLSKSPGPWYWWYKIWCMGVVFLKT